jgi:hypothetical protein
MVGAAGGFPAIGNIDPEAFPVPADGGPMPGDGRMPGGGTMPGGGSTGGIAVLLVASEPSDEVVARNKVSRLGLSNPSPRYEPVARSSCPVGAGSALSWSITAALAFLPRPPFNTSG